LFIEFYFITLKLAIMKILNIVFILIFVSLFGCTKKEDITLPKSEVAKSKPISELIIGSWHLTSIGTISQVSSSSSYSTNSVSNSGCGGGSSSNDETNWSNASLKENMSFQLSGDFTKATSSDAVCIGTYKLSEGAIFMKTGCSANEQKQVIYSINDKTLIIEQDQHTLYRYEK
jgi:hypothetical protein